MYRTLVSWLRLSNQGSRGTNTPAIALLFISAVAILSFPSLSHAAEDTELERLTAYWKGEAPWCPSPAIIGDKVVSIEFASKDQHEKSAQGDRIPCNDGDSVMFNGLLCLAGVEADQTDDKADTKAAKPLREVGCNVVKYSQTTTKDSPDYGRWWRSPRRVYLAKQNQQSEGGSELTFSNDHALGVMAYIAATKDVDAFRAWTQWIRDKAGPCQSTSCFLVGLPRYCPDDRCGFKFADCPLLDRLAQYLGVENAACSSDNVKKAQEGAWAKLDLALVPFNAILPQLKAVINKYGAGEPGAHTPERYGLLA